MVVHDAKILHSPENHPKGPLWLENTGWTVSKFWPDVEMGT